jgi:hypothetical protein
LRGAREVRDGARFVALLGYSLNEPAHTAVLQSFVSDAGGVNLVVDRVCSFRKHAETVGALNKLLAKQKKDLVHASKKEDDAARLQICTLSFWMAVESCVRNCTVDCDGHAVIALSLDVSAFTALLQKNGVALLCGVGSVSATVLPNAENWNSFAVELGYSLEINETVKGGLVSCSTEYIL